MLNNWDVASWFGLQFMHHLGFTWLNSIKCSATTNVIKSIVYLMITRFVFVRIAYIWGIWWMLAVFAPAIILISDSLYIWNVSLLLSAFNVRIKCLSLIIIASWIWFKSALNSFLEMNIRNWCERCELYMTNASHMEYKRRGVFVYLWEFQQSGKNEKKEAFDE